MRVAACGHHRAVLLRVIRQHVHRLQQLLGNGHPAPRHLLARFLPFGRTLGVVILDDLRYLLRGLEVFLATHAAGLLDLLIALVFAHDDSISVKALIRFFMASFIPIAWSPCRYNTL